MQTSQPARDRDPPGVEPGAAFESASNASVRGFIKLALGGLYLVAAVCWTLPPGQPVCAAVVRLATIPFRALGLWQAWDMFAPDPMPADIYVSFSAVLDDGTLVNDDLTNMQAMDMFTRYADERWRRFCNDHLRLDDNRRLWQGAARWFAARIERETGRPVRRLVLWRHWRPAVPVREDDGPPKRPDWMCEPFYVWEREP